MILSFHFYISHSVVINNIPKTGPPPEQRTYHLMDYNALTNELIIFGGSNGIDTFYNDIWKFDIKNNLYTHIMPSSEEIPVGRNNAGGFIDSENNKFYVFGGLAMNGPQNDMWSFAFNGSQWSREEVTGDVPKARERFGFTKLNYSNHLTFAIFGGKLASSADSGLYLFHVAEKRWELLSTSGSKPSDVVGTSLQYFNNAFYVAGGIYTNKSQGSFQDTFRLSLATLVWEKLAVAEKYTQRTFFGSAILGSSLYLLFGYSDSSLESLSDIYSLNLNSPQSWTRINSVNCPSLDSFSSISIGTSVYIFGGSLTNDQRVVNSLHIFSQNLCEIVSDDYISPPARMFHSMESANGKMYIYGGKSFDSILSDMWSYLPSTGWTSIPILGDSPGARYGHCSASQGDVIVIWGGQNNVGYLNDMYLYTISTGSWSLIEPEGTYPSPRVGACMVIHLPKLYIYGGLTVAGLSNGLWEYDTSNNAYTQLYTDDAKAIPEASSYPTCQFNHTAIIVMMGVLSSDTPSSSVFSYDTISNEWIDHTKVILSNYGRSLAMVQYVSGYVIVISGEAWSTDPFYEALSINLSTGALKTLFSLPFLFYAGAFALVKTTVFMHGGGQAFGNVLSLSTPTNRFFSIDFTTVSDFSAVCSPGSYNTLSDCALCDPGTYSENFDENSCISCPTGTYNSFAGASSADQCYPCLSGSYTNRTGSTYCLQCPIGNYCPIGSSMYLDQPLASLSSSSQPQSYQFDTQKLNEQKLKLYISVPLIYFFFFVLFVSIQKVRDIAKRLDMFKTEHIYDLYKHMHMEKNGFGGVFSIMFVVVAVFLIVLSTLTYQSENILEEKALMPLVILEKMTKSIASTMHISLTLYSYGGVCYANCSSAGILKVSTDSITYTRLDISCYGVDDNCVAELICYNCHINEGGNIQLSFVDKSSYASGLVLNITSNSSIPNEVSSVELSTIPSDNKVFRGFSPTVFNLEMIPSLFESYASEYPSELTGYHISINTVVTPGSQYSISEIAFSSDLKINLNLEKSTNGLYTSRSYQQSLFLFLSTMLGSVFGIMGAFDGTMRIIEGSWIKYSRSNKKKRANSDIRKDRTRLKNFLSNNKRGGNTLRRFTTNLNDFTITS